MGLREQRATISKCASEYLRENIERLGIIKATVHTSVYTMHKFWARRSWIVFRKLMLILLFTRLGDIILDPFAGGGVKIMKHEIMPLNVELYGKAVKRLKEILEPIVAEACGGCGLSSRGAGDNEADLEVERATEAGRFKNESESR